ncbi:hypothetical protein FHG66_05975 [Rubellimicrobium rubrum]|uniref:KfrA N-terminal DNA-binding domain-containing protein n=1 Tax=Rubellimicrobium rubrum TaxID=2585369 RepID=A0A5C4MY28_9RHOB|nr:hypothetical protein [Rubellimicrobium rubrum]TNC51099.1 hypothetical protein FHG66_05975 [Rubellimicrobium rubrum]
MGQGHAIYREDYIIAAGEALEHKKGSAVSAWEVFDSLGKRGKFERVEKIWAVHVGSRNVTAATVADDLPEQFVTGLDQAIGVAATSIRALMAGESARQTASHLRQIQRLESQHADEITKCEDKIAALKEENANWSAEVSRLGDREEELTRELERERDLRRKAEDAASRALPLPWPLPILGDRVPLVSPIRLAPPSPSDRPVPLVDRFRRDPSRSEARWSTTGDDASEGSNSETPPTSSADPNQMELPI